MIAKIIALGWIGAASQLALPESLGQHPQAPAWSPTPFQATPSSTAVGQPTAHLTAQNNTAPYNTAQNNSLHRSAAVETRVTTSAMTGAGASAAGSGTKEALIQRWKKLDNPSRSMPEAAAYARPLTEATGGPVMPAAMDHVSPVAPIGVSPARAVASDAPQGLPPAIPSSMQPSREDSSSEFHRAPSSGPAQAWRAAVSAPPAMPLEQGNAELPDAAPISEEVEAGTSSPRLNLIPSSPATTRVASKPDVELTSYYQAESSSAQSRPREPANGNSSQTSSANRWVARTAPESKEASGSTEARVPAHTTSGTRTIPATHAPRSLLVREASPQPQDPPQLPPPALPSGTLPPALGPQLGQPPQNAPVLDVPRAPNGPSGIVPPPARNAGEPPARLDLGSESTPPKRTLEPVVPSPFPSGGQDPLDSPSDRSSTSDPRSEADDLPPTPPSRSDRVGTNCDAIRTFAAGTDIRNVKVDSSPSFVQGYQGDDRRGSNTKDSFVKQSRSRVWRSETGEQVAEGRLVDMVFGTVIIEREDGARVSFLQRKLSDPDQVFVAESWGVPITCTIGSEGFAERHFAASTMTWKASGACHQPLYFEDVQLERYGHEWGPVVQPVASSLRFFGDIAVLPYKMGIHPPTECQYPLGYYRPGSCAPWTLGPIPISLRGAVEQAKVVTGAVFILP